MQPPHSSVDPLGSAQRAAVVAHYQRVVPWLLPHVAGTPLIVALYPGGLDTPPTFLASLHDEPKLGGRGHRPAPPAFLSGRKTSGRERHTSRPMARQTQLHGW